jgi:hypothetical protein
VNQPGPSGEAAVARPRLPRPIPPTRRSHVLITNSSTVECSFCSVPVLPGGGRICDGGPLAVLCRHCEAYKNACLHGDGTLEIPPGPPPGCEATIRVRVLSIEPDCWNCDKPALCMAGLHPDKPSPTYCGLFRNRRPNWPGCSPTSTGTRTSPAG